MTNNEKENICIGLLLYLISVLYTCLFIHLMLHPLQKHLDKSFFVTKMFTGMLNYVKTLLCYNCLRVFLHNHQNWLGKGCRMFADICNTSFPQVVKCKYTWRKFKKKKKKDFIGSYVIF